MTKRLPTSIIQNLWHDAQTVDKNDMDTEQNHNNQTNAAIVNNFFGSGILVNSPSQAILFDSNNLDVISAALLSANKFDGSGINVTTQPSDNNLGNQIEIELSESDVFGRLSTKVLIIGLSFNDQLIYERFTFYRNEKQVSVNHYKKILTLLFNDFLGNGNCSLNNGGRIIIKEAFSFELSRDPIMVSQDVEPNIFFRDFKVSDGYVGLFHTIQNAIGSEFNADDLRINITGNTRRLIAANDVTTQVGQKFLATTNNIQKITFLMGAVGNYSGPIANRFDWAGNLIVSVYQLQTTVSCPTDIIPELAIDFDPNPVPLCEVSFSQAELLDQGYILTDVAQPVDFVFNSTKIGQVGGIVSGKYYAISFRRSGSTSSGTIFCETGSDFTVNSRSTVFSGSTWVDTNEEDLWFQIWTDASKVSSGAGYDAGNGIEFNKTAIDEQTGATIDSSERYFSFSSTGQGTLNIGVIKAISKDSVTIQDERTGNPEFSRQQFVPSFSFVDNIGLEALQNISEPLIIGAVVDNNPKINPTVTKTQTIPGLVKNDTFKIVNPDPDLLSLQLIGSKLIPNTSSSANYRIFKVTFCTDGYGDVLGTGTIDINSVARATELIGESISSTTTQAKIVAGLIDPLELLRADVNGDGVVTITDVNLIQNFVNKTINAFPVGSSFNHLTLQVQQATGRMDGYFQCTPFILIDGYKTLPSSLTPQELVYDGYYTSVIMNSDPAFSAIPFSSINFQIKFQSFWQDYLLTLSSNSRLMPTTFTSQVGTVINSCTTASTFSCQDRVGVIPVSDSGRCDYFIPDNLILGKGEIIRPDGSNYKIDFEIGTIILELPASVISEKSINIFESFVVDTGNGFTAANYPCLRYSDCSTVKSVDLIEGKIKFSVSIQSINSNLHVSGSTVANLIGIAVDPNTGLMTLSSPFALSDAIFSDLRTRIQILVYLKKGGWNNQALIIPGNEVAGLFS